MYLKGFITFFEKKINKHLFFWYTFAIYLKRRSHDLLFDGRGFPSVYIPLPFFKKNTWIGKIRI